MGRVNEEATIFVPSVFVGFTDGNGVGMPEYTVMRDLNVVQLIQARVNWLLHELLNKTYIYMYVKKELTALSLMHSSR